MSLVIENGRLKRNGRAATWKPDPHTSGRFAAPPQVLVLHYGAGTQASDVASLLPGFVSAHFSLGRDGKIVQMVSTDEVAWHAGDGHMAVKYHGRSLNYTALGIEIENLGWLNRDDGDVAWREEDGRRTPTLPLADCIRTPHPLRGGPALWWPTFPEKQVRVLYDLCAALTDAYTSITYLVGHDEVSPQKYDPGPAFDMDAWRAMLWMRRVPKEGRAQVAGRLRKGETT